MRRLLCTVLVAGLAACAGDPATSVRQATEGPVVCERVTPTGSNLSATRCTRPVTASEHMDTRDAVRTLAGPGAPAAGPAGH